MRLLVETRHIAGGPTHDALRAWLRANGIDPHRTPIGPIHFDDDEITVRQFIVDGYGQRVIDGDGFARETLTVPLVEPLPAELLRIAQATDNDH